jgi:mono/diheme cytochrome c family protein
MKPGTLVKPLLIAGLLMAGPVAAAPTAQQVLSASPVDDIVAQYPAMMSQGIRDGLKRSGQVPPVVAETVGHLVSSSFNADKIEQQVEDALAEGLTDKQLEAVANWYKTPVAKKISAAEIAASAPAVWQDIQENAPALNKKIQRN